MTQQVEVAVERAELDRVVLKLGSDAADPLEAPSRAAECREGRLHPATRFALFAPTIARPSRYRTSSYGSPVSGNDTVGDASEKTFGTIAPSDSSTRSSSPSFLATARYWWSWRPRRKFASWSVEIGPSIPRSSSE